MKNPVSRKFIGAGRAEFVINVDPAWARRNGVQTHIGVKIIFSKRSKQLNVSLKIGHEWMYFGLLQYGRARSNRSTNPNIPLIYRKIVGRVCLAIFEHRHAEMEAAGWSVQHIGKCGRCGRKLTDPDSINRGIGPECIKLVNYVDGRDAILERMEKKPIYEC